MNYLESSLMYICFKFCLFCNAVKIAQSNTRSTSKFQQNAIIFSDNCDSKKADDVIECHRAIIASRCPWFRRALLAGMKESRER